MFCCSILFSFALVFRFFLSFFVGGSNGSKEEGDLRRLIDADEAAEVVVVAADAMVTDGEVMADDEVGADFAVVTDDEVGADFVMVTEGLSTFDF